MMPQARCVVDESVGDAETAMQVWFPPGPLAQRQPFDETTLRSVANALRSIGRDSWATIPRIYVTLRIINQLPAIESFLAQGLSDTWFPFTHKTLPSSLKSQTARNDFIEAQGLVLTKGLDLVKEGGKHRHFSKPEDIPLVKLSELGRGGFGVVDKVLSTVDQREYARKLLRRGPTFQKNKELLKEFEKELATLKKLSHLHIVEFVGSYTDPKYVAIIMLPVADCNLAEFLESSLTSDGISLLRMSFGCLVAAVNHLHENRIRHKDIKPQNILVKDHQMYVTDFGISRDWTDLGHSTTTGPTFKTPRYCAPEVAASQPRNSSADIWSLGCVFIEMWTVLCGESVQNLIEHLRTPDNQSACYHDKLDRVDSWKEVLAKKTGDTELNRPCEWISAMMCPDSRDRPNGQSLLDTIQGSCLDSGSRYAFIGFCCTEHDDSAESVQSSLFEPIVNEAPPETATVSTLLSNALPDCTLSRGMMTNSEEETIKLIMGKASTPSNDVALTPTRPNGQSYKPNRPDPPRQSNFDTRTESRPEPRPSEISVHGCERTEEKTTVLADKALVKTFQFHSYAFSLAFSPDGKRLAWEDANTMQLRCTKSGMLVQTLAMSYSVVSPLVFSPDSKRLVFASFDKFQKPVQLCCAESGTLVTKISVAKNYSPKILDFSPDSTRLVSMYDSCTVRLSSAESGALVQTLAVHEDEKNQVMVLIFSPDSKRIASSHRNGTVRLWVAESGTLVQMLKGPEHCQVNLLAFSPDSKRLVSIYNDDKGSMRLWSTEAGALVQKLAHGGGYPSVTFSPDGKWMASTAFDSMIRLWSTESGKLEDPRQYAQGDFCVFSPDGKRLAALGSHDHMWLWSTQSWRKVLDVRNTEQRPFIPRPPDRRLMFSSDSKRLVFVIGGDVRLYSTTSGKLIQRFRADPESAQPMRLSPDGKRLAIISATNSTVQIWSAKSGTLVKTLEGHSAKVIEVIFSPDGKQLVTSGLDNTVRLWDVSEEES